MDTAKTGATPHEDKKHGDHHDHDDKFVVVHLNKDPPKRIKAGKYTGKTLKLALGVPVEHELEQVVHGKFEPVKNDDEIHIKGGEKFVTQCGQGQSS